MPERIEIWKSIQHEIAVCRECIGRWPKRVIFPVTPGEIPDPPDRIKILFIGVAPTAQDGQNEGSHFYSSPCDQLRNGLFRLLRTELSIPFEGLELDADNNLFHRSGFFFVHAAKVRPIGNNAPPPAAILFCAQRHLRKEIVLLNPHAVCFVGANNLMPVAQALFGAKISEVPRPVSLDAWSGLAAVAHQPIRGWKNRTAKTIELLLKG